MLRCLIKVLFILTEMPFTKLERPILFFILEKQRFMLREKVKSIFLTLWNQFNWSRMIVFLWRSRCSPCERDFGCCCGVLAQSGGIPWHSQAPVLVKGYEELFVYVSLMGQRGLLSNRTPLEGHGKTWDREKQNSHVTRSLRWKCERRNLAFPPLYRRV